ncbi:myelin-associated glycoprotein-like isoform X1 [Arapaima gigas]
MGIYNKNPAETAAEVSLWATWENKSCSPTMYGLSHVLLLNFLLSDVACSSWSAKMPQNLLALADSCLLIPCLFEVMDDHADQVRMPASGVWRKGSQWFAGSTDVFNSSKSQNILSGQILGDLMAKNCTSILDRIPHNYSDRYYFRLETGFKLTFENAVNVIVTVFPQKPKVSQVTTIREGTPLILTCRAPAPCPHLPPKLSWTPLLGDDAETLEENQNGTLSVLSVLNFTISHLHHKQMVTCTANYSLQTGSTSRRSEQSFHLTVLYSPKNTKATVRPSDVVANGTLVTLLCSSDSNPPIENYTWFREQGSKVTLWGTGQNLSFYMTPNDAGLYYCTAQNLHGMERSSAVNLILEEQWKFTVVLGVIGGSVTLVLAVVILCLLRWRKPEESLVSADTKDQKEDHCEFYENMAPRFHFKTLASEADQSQQGQDENIYNNSAMFPMGKPSCLSEAGSDGNIYANSVSVLSA